MKADKDREELRRIVDAARQPDEPASVETLRRALRSRSNQLIARAARAARETRLAALLPDAAAAFPRLMASPVKSDPTCIGKLELARCLAELDHPADDLFLAGVRHVQMEPAWGKPVDTAAELRGTCALALVTMRHPDGPAEAARLLADPEAVARAGGARALGACRLPGASLALRLHVLRGEAEPDVLGEALLALLGHEGSAALGFMTERLASRDLVVAQAAALALGDWRDPAALPPIVTRLGDEHRPEVRRALVLGLAALRIEQAFDALLTLVESGSKGDSAVAAEAIGIHASDAALQDRLAEALAGRRARGGEAGA